MLKALYCTKFKMGLNQPWPGITIGLPGLTTMGGWKIVTHNVTNTNFNSLCKIMTYVESIQ